MNATQIKTITRARLANWNARVTENHSTPAVLVAVGHDHQSGNLHICLPPDLPLPLARTYLTQALAELNEAIAKTEK